MESCTCCNKWNIFPDVIAFESEICIEMTSQNVGYENRAYNAFEEPESIFYSINL